MKNYELIAQKSKGLRSQGQSENDEQLTQNWSLCENNELPTQKTQGLSEKDKLLWQKSQGLSENNKVLSQNLQGFNVMKMKSSCRKIRKV